MSRIDQEEREILGAFEAGELKRASDAAETQKRRQEYTEAMFKKDARICTQIIIRSFCMKSKQLPPIHPGEILMEEFLEPMKISQYRLAKDISVSPRRINEIVHGKRAITADTALRLGRFFGMAPQFWLNLQTRFDLETTEDLLANRLDNEVRALQLQTG